MIVWLLDVSRKPNADYGVRESRLDCKNSTGRFVSLPAEPEIELGRRLCQVYEPLNRAERNRGTYALHQFRPFVARTCRLRVLTEVTGTMPVVHAARHSFTSINIRVSLTF